MSEATKTLVTVRFEGECDDCGASVARDFAIWGNALTQQDERRVYCGACHAITLCTPARGGVEADAE